MIGGQSEKNQQRNQQQHKPQKHVQGAAARRRKNNANRFHGGLALALELPQTCREQAAGADEESQSKFYYLRTEGEF
jgi:hypothetical protein